AGARIGEVVCAGSGRNKRGGVGKLVNIDSICGSEHRVHTRGLARGKGIRVEGPGTSSRGKPGGGFRCATGARDCVASKSAGLRARSSRHSRDGGRRGTQGVAESNCSPSRNTEIQDPRSPAKVHRQDEARGLTAWIVAGKGKVERRKVVASDCTGSNVSISARGWLVQEYSPSRRSQGGGDAGGRLHSIFVL